MQRLIADAAELSDTVDAQDMSFANIVKAINVVQTEMGITGTTAKEAASTIQGSVGMMQSAWANLMTGIADKNADMSALVSSFVDSVGTVAQNILPVVETALSGIGSLIKKLAPEVIKILPSLVKDVVPSLISAATEMVNAVIDVLPDLLETVVEALIENAPALIEASIGLVQSLIQGIKDNYQILVDGAIQIVTQLATGILNMLPQIVKLGLDLIVSLINGITEAIQNDQFIQTIIDVVTQIVNTLTDPETLNKLLDAAVELIFALSDGLADAIPQLVDAAIDIILNLIDFLLDPENIIKMHEAAFKLIFSLIEGLINSIPKLLEGLGQIVVKIFDFFTKTDWGQIGRDLVSGFRKGIENAWNNLVNWFTGLFGDLIGIAKRILGIASPSKVFKKIGAFTAEGFGEGFNKAFASVEKDIENALDYDGTTFGINAYGSYDGNGVLGGIGGTSFGTVNISVDGANVQNDEELADMIAERLQDMTERRGAVFA